jgi:hypothetical protein
MRGSKRARGALSWGKRFKSTRDGQIDQSGIDSAVEWRCDGDDIDSTPNASAADTTDGEGSVIE